MVYIVSLTSLSCPTYYYYLTTSKGVLDILATVSAVDAAIKFLTIINVFWFSLLF